MPVLARPHVFETAYMERVNNHRISPLRRDHHRSRCEEDEARVRNRILTPARRDQPEWSELFNALANGFKIHSRRFGVV